MRPSGYPFGAKLKTSSGFTLVEVLCSVAILAILMAMAVMSYDRILASSGQPRCLANMRSLHSAFSSYIDDKGYWPQQPMFGPNDEKGYGEWWINTMHPYVASDKVWLCPTIQAAQAQTKKPMLIHYTPTVFDAFRNRPFQWSTMPWLIEVGNAHGNGVNVLFPDGSIRNFDSILSDWK